MVINNQGLYGRLFWIVNIIWGTFTLSTLSVLNHHATSISLDWESIGPVPLGTCKPIFIKHESTRNSDIFLNIISHLLMGSLPASVTCNNLVTLALFQFVCIMVGGWVNVLQRSGLLDSLWEIRLSSYSPSSY